MVMAVNQSVPSCHAHGCPEYQVTTVSHCDNILAAQQLSELTQRHNRLFGLFKRVCHMRGRLATTVP
jgi:hypothetical protein